MNSVRINLLPEEVAERNAARRVQAAAGAGALVVLVLLAGLYMWQLGRVNDAKDELAVQQAEVQRLQAEVNDLAEYQRLADQVDLVDASIVALLGGEASFAGILQDLAAVMPSDASIETLTIAVQADGTGTLTASAKSLTGHAPGVERFLISLDKVAAFDNVFFTSSTIDDVGIASFTFTVDLTPLILTGRYADGLPEVMR